jgi:hypothetical protein
MKTKHITNEEKFLVLNAIPINNKTLRASNQTSLFDRKFMTFICGYSGIRVEKIGNFNISIPLGDQLTMPITADQGDLADQCRASVPDGVRSRLYR